MQIKAKMYDEKTKDYTIDVIILAFLSDSGRISSSAVAVYYDAKTLKMNSHYVDYFKLSLERGITNE